MQANTKFDDPSEAQLAEWTEQFSSASPFPHMVIDEFVANGHELSQLFPSEDWEGWNAMGDRYQAGKRSCDDIDLIPAGLREMIIHLNSPCTLRTLERITGIPRLLTDPYLYGAGLHASGPGGVLAPHSDFHHHALGLYRRLNLLVYLNEGWRAEDGGALELYPDAAARETPKSVVPVAGRAVLFVTDDRSVHGFTKPVAPGKERRSIALYYYTAAEAPEFSGDSTTLWRHTGDHGGVDRLRLLMRRVLLKISREFSKLAYLVDPNRTT